MEDSPIACVQAYLDSIPGRLAGYPETLVKYSVLDTWLEGHDLTALALQMPGSLHYLFEPGFPVSKWVPEVHAMVTYLTQRELFFDSDDAFVADALERNIKLFRRPIYRVLVRLISMSLAAQGPARVYSQMHRGTELAVIAAPNAWTVKLTHPPHLIPALLARCYGTAMRAAILEKGGTNVEVVSLSTTPEQMVHEIRFDTFR